ncbi:flagellar hook-length control protein FliK [Pseudomonas stutzeri]|nr:flagellar hook-length control protein FliK [Stutzerimonas stutzeri]
MDISIIAASSAAPPRSASAAGKAGDGSFANQLQQAGARPSTTARPSAASTPAANAQNAPAAPAERATSGMPAAALPAGMNETPPLPPSGVPGEPVALPELAADGTSPDAVGGDPLEEIRRRLALIEQAGQLPTDAAAAGLAGPAVPPAAATRPTAATLPDEASEASAPREFAARSSAAEPAALAAPQPAAERDALPPARSEPAANRAPAVDALPGTRDDGPATTAVDSAPRGEPLPPLPSAVSGATAQTAVAPGTAPGGPALTAPLASPQWQAGLGQQLIGLHQRGEQQVELHLHPAELGPLSISLKVSELGAQAQFLSAHPQVRAAVEQAIPQLREALAAQGISLGETSVGEQRQPAGEQPAGDGGSRRDTARSEAGENPEEPLVSRPLRSLSGQVDLYA